MSEVVQHRPKFCTFLAPNFFGGEPPEFWKLDYKIGPVSNHVAKFHGDRPRDLGITRWKKETSRAFYKSSRYSVRAA